MYQAYRNTYEIDTTPSRSRHQESQQSHQYHPSKQSNNTFFMQDQGSRNGCKTKNLSDNDTSYRFRKNSESIQTKIHMLENQTNLSENKEAYQALLSQKPQGNRFTSQHAGTLSNNSKVQRYDPQNVENSQIEYSAQRDQNNASSISQRSFQKGRSITQANEISCISRTTQARHQYSKNNYSPESDEPIFQRKSHNDNPLYNLGFDPIQYKPTIFSKVTQKTLNDLNALQQQQQNSQNSLQNKISNESSEEIDGDVELLDSLQRFYDAKKRIKIAFITVIAAMRFKKAGQLREQINRQEWIDARENTVQNKIELYKQNLGKYLERERSWVRAIVGKITSCMGQLSFYQRFNARYDPKAKISVDSRKLYLQNFAKFLLQNLELATRQNNMPDNLKMHLIMSLFKKENSSPSTFVQVRTKFINVESLEISEDEKLLIFAETLFFNIIVQNMFLISNKMWYNNTIHTIECKIQFISLASLLHLFFVKRFANLEQIGSRFKLIQKEMFKDPDQNLFLRPSSKVDNQVVISELYSEEIIGKIFSSNSKLFEHLEIIFNKIIDNLDQYIKL